MDDIISYCCVWANHRYYRPVVVVVAGHHHRPLVVDKNSNCVVAVAVSVHSLDFVMLADPCPCRNNHVRAKAAIERMTRGRFGFFYLSFKQTLVNVNRILLS